MTTQLRVWHKTKKELPNTKRNDYYNRGGAPQVNYVVWLYQEFKVVWASLLWKPLYKIVCLMHGKFFV